MSTQGAGQDKVVLYASLFLYKPKLRGDYSNYAPSIDSYEQSKMIPEGSSKRFSDFLSKNDEEQRSIIADKDQAEAHIRLFFEIVKKVKGDHKLVTLALLLIDGILEDNRGRIQYLVSIQRYHKKDKKEDLIGVLLSFILQNNEKDNDQRDLASHILAMLIEAHEYKNCANESRSFLNWLLEQKSKLRLSIHAYTFSLMYLLKTNEMAREFVDQNGFELFSLYLEDECLADHQIAYNVVCALWIISYHPFAMKGFDDYRNIKTNEASLEQMSDINAVYIVTKLQNRHWVDKDITDLLDKLYEYLDENYKIFNSIDRWKKEVNKRSLKWGPVHSEKFWTENFIYFNEKENLDLIKIVIELLDHDDDKVKSIACYDLGEFARYFPMGRNLLERLGVKTKIIEVMGKRGSTAELKKEAITCYQKMLMTSWSGNEFK